jgi:hypothetical protein
VAECPRSGGGAVAERPRAKVGDSCRTLWAYIPARDLVDRRVRAEPLHVRTGRWPILSRAFWEGRVSGLLSRTRVAQRIW